MAGHISEVDASRRKQVTGHWRMISSLSQPQRSHLVNLCDGLLVCESEKTLAAL
jgi:hypothetical protein